MANSLVQVTNDLIRANPDKVQQARNKPQLAGWFVGQIMKETRGAYLPSDILAVLVKRGIGLTLAGGERAHD